MKAAKKSLDRDNIKELLTLITLNNVTQYDGIVKEMKTAVKKNMIDVEQVKAEAMIKTNYRCQICFYHYVSSEADLEGYHLQAPYTEGYCVSGLSAKLLYLTKKL